MILNEGLKTGADYAEIYYQDSKTRRYVRRYRKVEGVTTKKKCGVGIRLIKGKQVAYGYTSDLSIKTLCELAASLALCFEGEKVVELFAMKKKKIKNLSIIRTPHDAWTTDKKLDYLKSAEDEAFSVSEKVVDVSASLFEEDERVEIYNSTGFCFADDRVRTRLGFSVTTSDGEQFQTSFFGPGLSQGLELLEDRDFNAEARSVAEEALAKLSAVDGPSGEMPVVLGNGFGGVLFHEACGHPLEGCAIYHKTSPFSDKLGKKIASDVVNAIDDGTIPNGWGTVSVDDEGNPPTKNHLITDGVLTNYMTDRFTSRQIGDEIFPSGSCRREGYYYQPTTRMTNTYIDNGKSTPEEIIRSVKNGIYCKGFTGGQVDPSTDQFIFTSDLAYLIRDGEIKEMIKSVSMMGYGYEILPRITMVGNDLKRAPGVCGSSSGSCFVEVGQPTLLISKILIGGTGGN